MDIFFATILAACRQLSIMPCRVAILDEQIRLFLETVPINCSTNNGRTVRQMPDDLQTIRKYTKANQKQSRQLEASINLPFPSIYSCTDECQSGLL